VCTLESGPIVISQPVPVQLANSVDVAIFFVSSRYWHHLESLTQNRLASVLAKLPDHIRSQASAVNLNLNLRAFAALTAAGLACAALHVVANLAALPLTQRTAASRCRILGAEVTEEVGAACL
jgi:hypothetical protein